MQQFHPFRRERFHQKADASYIALGSAETGNETQIDRVCPGCENDRGGRGRCFGGQRSRRTDSNDYRHWVINQFGCQRRQSIELTTGRAIFNCNIAAFDEAGFLEALCHRADLSSIKVAATEQADQCHHRLLRPRRERPRGRRAYSSEELATLHHSITSSARARSVGDTSRPNALAVLRLMTSSYLVGACTGNSPGFSPFRMRSTYVAARHETSA